jgi:spermidine synthase
MNRRLAGVSLLLFGSGACALMYQTVWLRQFRLIFGASTAASAAVLAIFMGGLGLGGWLLGRRADRHERPLLLYGWLEVGIAVSAALTPLLLYAVRAIYLATGGSASLGITFATILRLVLATLVLLVPTVLMGGTLPAAVRAVQRSGDRARSGVAVLYAANAIGAVAGAALATFFLLERFGNLRALIASALLNALIGLIAMSLGLRSEAAEAEPAESSDEVVAARLSPRLVYGAAAITGFAFFLMELVWYRMLTPLLGGTTYTFGLILAVALAGIGCGSFFHAALRRREATATAFAVTCALEALFLAIPYALGDRLAFAALLTRPLGALGFGGYVLSWTAITMVVVFPVSFIAGVQFPLLISLLGRGREEVGQHVGTAYLFNTLGSITGSIAGGFGLLPLLTATGAWRASTWLLVGTALVTVFFAPGKKSAWSAVALGVAGLALLALRADGPSAFWRHTPIGAGRADIVRPDRNRLLDLRNTRRRSTPWEAEGVESSVALSDSDGYAFIVNGKSDGHARFDAGTQIMGGLLPALLHPAPRTAAVIGLGTGTTAGWLGAVPGIERVDAVEIEPSIVEVARRCTPVNRDVLRNGKVQVVIGDGREFLLTSGRTYDVISSEPSNPYRAGIANLFTTEFYRAVDSRLNRGGMLVQFLQAYEVDAPTIETIYATITDVFPHVETWQSAGGDLLLVASRDPVVHDWNRMSQRLTQEVFRSGVRSAWAVNDTAGVYARYVAGTQTARHLAGTRLRNTDDKPRVEYGFARTLGQGGAFNVSELRTIARTRIDDVPQAIRNVPDAASIESARLSIALVHDTRVDLHSMLSPELTARGAAQMRYLEGGFADAWLIWQGQRTPPSTPLERITFAEVLAERGDAAALPLIESLRPEFPIESDILLARLLWRQSRGADAADTLARAFETCRTNPWALPLLLRRAFRLANEMAQNNAEVARLLERSLAQPFAVELFKEQRKSTLLLVQTAIAGAQCSRALVETLHTYEPNVPWQPVFLEKRAACYAQQNDPFSERAARDLREYRRGERAPLESRADDAP